MSRCRPGAPPPSRRAARPRTHSRNPIGQRASDSRQEQCTLRGFLSSHRPLFCLLFAGCQVFIRHTFRYAQLTRESVIHPSTTVTVMTSVAAVTGNIRIRRDPDGVRPHRFPRHNGSDGGSARALPADAPGSGTRATRPNGHRLRRPVLHRPALKSAGNKRTGSDTAPLHRPTRATNLPKSFGIWE